MTLLSMLNWLSASPSPYSTDSVLARQEHDLARWGWNQAIKTWGKDDDNRTVNGQVSSSAPMMMVSEHTWQNSGQDLTQASKWMEMGTWFSKMHRRVFDEMVEILQRYQGDALYRGNGYRLQLALQKTQLSGMEPLSSAVKKYENLPNTPYHSHLHPSDVLYE